MEINFTATFEEEFNDVFGSEFLEPNEPYDPVPFVKYAIGVVLVAIITLSIIGNFLVCLAIYTDRRLRKLGNLFLVSLALADLFVACLVMTFAVANDLMGYWAFGQQFCEVWIASDIMLTTCSILNLSAIAIDR